jgi:hypothetical protein
MTTYTNWTRTSRAYAAYQAAAATCDTAFTPAPTMPAPAFGEWRRPGTTEIRRYVNNIHELIGLDISRYRTGNISSASLGDEWISNSDAGRLGSNAKELKIWVDADGILHWRNTGWSARAMTADDVINRVRACVAAHA